MAYTAMSTTPAAGSLRALDGTKFVMLVEWEYDPKEPIENTSGGLVLSTKGPITQFASRGSNARFNNGCGEHELNIMRLLSQTPFGTRSGREYDRFFTALTKKYGPNCQVSVRHGITGTDYVAVMTPRIWRQLGHEGVPAAGAASAAHWIQWENGEVWQATIDRWPLCHCDVCLSTKVVRVAGVDSIYGAEKDAGHIGHQLLADTVAEYNETLKESPWASSRT